MDEPHAWKLARGYMKEKTKTISKKFNAQNFTFKT